MSKSNPTRPNPPPDEASVRDREDLPAAAGPPLKDPRSISAMDNIGVDTPSDLLDVELDEQPGDDARGAAFANDVRSDNDDDERNERR
jgi:hypothetical protein